MRKDDKEIPVAKYAIGDDVYYFSPKHQRILESEVASVKEVKELDWFTEVIKYRYIVTCIMIAETGYRPDKTVLLEEVAEEDLWRKESCKNLKEEK